MKNFNEPPSLIPYLAPQGPGFKIDISLTSGDHREQEKSPFPFLVISESDPVARILEAKLTTDAGSEINRIFLFVQKDEYDFHDDALRPITNIDIEKRWQTAFAFYSEKDIDYAGLLAAQIGSDKSLLAFQPLFYCKSRQIFFPPLCPECGNLLDICKDDKILSDSGLLPYSTSLKRYMFCPSCFSSQNGGNFYVPRLESTDPPFLKDRTDLIKSFGRLLNNEKSSLIFPCAECSENQTCYGNNFCALSKIAVFSFYPFYALFFDGDAINALDFLSLISGASLDDIKKRLVSTSQLGRLQCLDVYKAGLPKKAFFFSSTSERYFLEVLYLKLSFLHELLANLLTDSDMFRYPDFGLSLERIWVKNVCLGGLLPFLWNFRLKFTDIGGNSPEMPLFSKYLPSYGPHFLGAVCFYALLVNKIQSITDVYASLGDLLEQSDMNDELLFSSSLLKDNRFKAFSPENIFWDPQGKLIPEQGRILWKESINFSWSLLKASLAADKQWSAVQFFKRLEKIRDQVEKSLFEQTNVPITMGTEPEAKQLSDILANILKKWDKNITEIPPREEIVDEAIETVILSSDDHNKKEPFPVETDDGTDYDMDKTVILCSNKEAEFVGEPDKFSPNAPETVIISPAPPKETLLSPQSAMPLADNSFEEKKTWTNSLSNGSIEGDNIKGDEEELMVQTVILKPPPDNSGPVKK